MILAGISISKILVGVLIVSLGLLVLVIAYRKFLAYLGKGRPVKENYAVLYGLDKTEVAGEVEFYFTLDQPRTIAFMILDQHMNDVTKVVEKEFGTGGHIVRFDTAALANGVYFYGLHSDNQKTIKRMVVAN